jgi:translation initiation factor IF-1
MPPDHERKRVAGKSGAKPVEATVIELLPSAAFRVELEDRGRVIAHAAGARAANFVRFRVGDKVLVELSPHDRTRGRIVRLLGKG